MYIEPKPNGIQKGVLVLLVMMKIEPNIVSNKEERGHGPYYFIVWDNIYFVPMNHLDMTYAVNFNSDTI